MKKIIFLIVIISTFAYSQYNLKTSTYGGGGKVCGGAYNLSGSAYQVHTGNISADDYTMKVGFWAVFSQLLPPTVSTTNISSITLNSAVSGGNVTNPGGSSVTARGVCWNTSGSPTTANSKTTNGTGTGSFTSSISGLNQSTIYYVRAYATNSYGTSYGEEVTFTTIPTLPEWGLIAFGGLIAIFAVRKIIKIV